MKEVICRMPVINTPTFIDYYSTAKDIPTTTRQTLFIPKGYTLSADTDGGTQYVPGNEMLLYSTLNVSSISSYSVTVYGANTFTCQGSTILTGSVYFSTFAFNSMNTTNIAIGMNAGQVNQGINTVAIGSYAGQSNQSTNTTILNATGVPLNSLISSALYVAPIRSDTSTPSTTSTRLPLYWDSSTNEITQGIIYIPGELADTKVYSTNNMFVNKITTYATVSTQELYISTINGRFYPGNVSQESTTVSTLKITTFAASDSLSTNVLLTSSINNAKYQPNRLDTTYYDMTISSLICNPISTKFLYISSINDTVYTSFTVLSSFSTIEYSSRVNSAFISTNAVLDISSINKVPYIPFTYQSTGSTLTLQSKGITNTMSTQQLSLSTVNGITWNTVLYPSTFSSFTVNSLISKSTSTNTIYVSSLNGRQYIPFTFISTFSTVNVSGIITTYDGNTNNINIGIYNGQKYANPVVTSLTASTVYMYQSTITINSEAENINVSTINGKPYIPQVAVTTLSSLSIISARVISSITSDVGSFFNTVSTNIISTTFIEAVNSLQSTLHVTNLSSIQSIFGGKANCTAVSTSQLSTGSITSGYGEFSTITTSNLVAYSTVKSVYSEIKNLSTVYISTNSFQSYDGSMNNFNASSIVTSSITCSTITVNILYAYQTSTVTTYEQLDTMLGSTFVNSVSSTYSYIGDANYSAVAVTKISTGSIAATFLNTNIAMSTNIVNSSNSYGTTMRMINISTMDLSTNSVIASNVSFNSLSTNIISAGGVLSLVDVPFVTLLNSISSIRTSTNTVFSSTIQTTLLSTTTIVSDSISGTTIRLANTISTNAISTTFMNISNAYLDNTTVLSTISTGVMIGSSITVYAFSTIGSISTGIFNVSSTVFIGLTTRTISTNTIAGNTVTISSISTNSFSTGTLITGFTNLFSFSTLAVSSGNIFTSVFSTTSITISSINKLVYMTPEWISTLSTIGVSTVLSTKSISSKLLNVSSINGSVYTFPYIVPSVFSTISTVSSISRNIFTSSLNFSTYNTINTYSLQAVSQVQQTLTNVSSLNCASSISMSTVATSVTYTSTLLIALGASGTPANTILYSLDGSNWNSANSGGFSNNGWGASVAYNPNGTLMVATGYGNSPANTILWSRDGSNWNNASSGGFLNANGGFGCGFDIKYGNGKWVAVGSGNTAGSTVAVNNAGVATNHVQISTDGSNWSNVILTASTSTGSGSGATRAPYGSIAVGVNLFQQLPAGLRADLTGSTYYGIPQVATDSNQAWILSGYMYAWQIVSLNNGVTWNVYQDNPSGGAAAWNANGNGTACVAYTSNALNGRMFLVGGAIGASASYPYMNARYAIAYNPDTINNYMQFNNISANQQSNLSLCNVYIQRLMTANGIFFASGYYSPLNTPNVTYNGITWNTGLVFSSNAVNWYATSGTNTVSSITWSGQTARQFCFYDVTYNPSNSRYYAVAATAGPSYTANGGSSNQQFSTILYSSDLFNWYPSITGSSATFNRELTTAIGGYAGFGIMYRPGIPIPGGLVYDSVSTASMNMRTASISSLQTTNFSTGSINAKTTPYWEFGSNTITSGSSAVITFVTSSNVPASANISVTGVATAGGSALYYTANYTSPTSFTVSKYTLNTGALNTTTTGNFYWLALWNA